VPDELSDRVVTALWWFSRGGDVSSGELAADIVSSGGNVAFETAAVSARFTDHNGSYQLRLKLTEAHRCSGIGARLRLRNWKQISYICIGYSWHGGYEHVKASNPALGQWFTLIAGHQDLAWAWRNGWNHPEPRQISDIRIYVKGQVDDASYLDVSDMFCWLEADAELPDAIAVNDHAEKSPSVINAIRDYERQCFPSYIDQASAFIESGRCPLGTGTLLDWPLDSFYPSELTATGTHQFSWHALHPATILMLYAHDKGHAGALFAARDFVANWLEKSFFRNDVNIKYAWYDHGTAERCLAFVQLYAAGQDWGFDHRFSARLKRAIFRHAQLLQSEVFYASHQTTRYHNHAWFQDLALLACTLHFPEWRCAGLWRNTALSRLEDQFAQLITRDGEYAIFIENSIGYHHGVQRLVRLAGELARLSGRGGTLAETSDELLRFSEFFRYPDRRRTPSQGDTFRLPNSANANPRGQRVYGNADVTILRRAGYAVVKADHEDSPFMLSMLATSLSRTHKHQDHLSFTLYFDGVEWLIDPSFYSHEYDSTIPAYLRSAAAHNCVSVPHLPYSIEPGLAKLTGEVTDDRCVLHGSHRAYADLTVQRRIGCALDRLLLTGEDRLSDLKPDAQLRFHCGEHVVSRVENGCAFLSHPGSDFRLVLEIDTQNIEKVRGDLNNAEKSGGIVGHGFQQAKEIDTLIINFGCEAKLTWQLKAERALD
jgi:hypothetical protein